MKKVSVCRIPNRIIHDLKRRECEVTIMENGRRILFTFVGEKDPIYCIIHQSLEVSSELVLVENGVINGSFSINDEMRFDLKFVGNSPIREKSTDIIEAPAKRPKYQKENIKEKALFPNMTISEIPETQLMMAYAKNGLVKVQKQESLELKLSTIQAIISCLVKYSQRNKSYTKARKYLNTDYTDLKSMIDGLNGFILNCN